MLKRHHLGYLMLIIVLVFILFIAFQPKPIVVDSVQAYYAPMQVTIEEQGKTRVVDHYVVSAPVDAYMQRIDLHEGDSIQQGQTLATLEPLPSSILDPRSRSQSQASLGATEELEKIIQQMSQAAQADKELADITFQRDTELRQKKVISQHDLDVSKAEKQRADASYRAFQFGQVLTRFLTQMSHSALNYEDNRQTRDKNHHFKLSSVTDGKILKLADKSARVVRMGTVLMEIGDIEHIEVETEVLSTLAVKLKPGMPAEILRWGGKQALQAEVKHIEPYGFTKISALGVEEQRVKVILNIKTEYNARKRLGHGYRVESRFILWRSDRVLQIPNSALFRDNRTATDNTIEQWAVYIIKDNALQKIALKICQRNSLMAEVIEGLDVGEQLVAYLSNELQDGVKIEGRK